jgi:hypothetical protein
VSDAFSEHRPARGRPEAAGTEAGDAKGTVDVHAVFRDVDAGSAETLAAEMIARAHELANRPEYECDVDVSVQCASPAAPVDEC